jgi:hypothetical protein
MEYMRKFFCLTAMLCLALPILASGHGPVFAYATPVNSKGEWSFDQGFLFRNTGLGSQLTARSLFTYGFTPHLQISFNTPAILTDSPMPRSRMSGGDDFESDLGWRFHHQVKGVGTRFESTAFAGIVVPGPQTGSGTLANLKRAPGFNGVLVSGFASRSQYFWLGSGYTRFADCDGDRLPSTFSYSLAYGYRPPVLRKDYPFWDWRLFGELVGEKNSRVLQGGAPVLGTEAHQVFVGPTTLGIYKSFAIEGGVQFPIYRNVGPFYPRERLRVAINVSYFLFQHGAHTH